MAPIPDVFRSPFQTSPLDLTTDAFYPSRRALIEDRLQASKGLAGGGVANHADDRHCARLGLSFDASISPNRKSPRAAPVLY